MTERITSRRNPLLEQVRRLDTAALRRKAGVFLCDSPKLVGEAVQHGVSVQCVIAADGVAFPERLPENVRRVTVPADVMASISPMPTPQGMLALCALPDMAAPARLSPGRYVVLGGTRCQVVSNTDAKLVMDKTVTVGDKEVIYPGEGGKQGCAVYGCLFLGKGAYGVVDLSEGTEVIVKPRGSSGTADPLDQRSSVGWKGVHAAAILYDEYMVRVECGSSYSDEDKAN